MRPNGEKASAIDGRHLISHSTRSLDRAFDGFLFAQVGNNLGTITNNRIESTSEIQEIHVAGEWAYCWNYLSVTITPLHGASPNRRRGPTLTVLRKLPDGGWVVFRDANLLAAEGT